MASSESKLAIYCPTVGAPSETFIERYVRKLLPGRTVVLTEFDLPATRPVAWSTDCPTFHLAKHNTFLRNKWWRLGRRTYSLPLLKMGFQEALRVLQQQQVEVLMGNWLDASWPLIHLCRSYGIEFFGHAHGYDLSQGYQDPKWQKRFRDYADAQGVIVVNQVMKQRLLNVGIPVDKIHLVPYGVEPARASQPPARGEVQDLRCLAVGRMVNKKAPIAVIEAFRRARLIADNLQLEYVGNGPLFAEAQRYVQGNELADFVTLHGQKSHAFVLDLMGRSDVLIQHSVVDRQTGDEEGLPLVILEAMAHGLPVVATRHAGIPEAVVHNETGLLVNEGDVEGMAMQLVDLARDHEKAATLGKQARNRYIEQFTWERERQRLLEVMGLS